MAGMSTSCVISAHIPKVQRCPTKRKCTIIKQLRNISLSEENFNLMQCKVKVSKPPIRTIDSHDKSEKKLPLPVNSQVIYVFLCAELFQNVCRAHINSLI